jgi:Flp pilus assembly protein TadB
MLCPQIGPERTSSGRQRDQGATEMAIYLAATAGVCLFVVLWATGLNADVAGLIALAILCLGILAQMAMPSSPPDESG